MALRTEMTFIIRNARRERLDVSPSCMPMNSEETPQTCSIDAILRHGILFCSLSLRDAAILGVSAPHGMYDRASNKNARHLRPLRGA